MDFIKSAGNSIKDTARDFAGNIPRAMLVVRNPSTLERDVYGYFKKNAKVDKGETQTSREMLAAMRDNLVKKYKTGKGKALRFDDVKNVVGNENESKYVVMAVQYNPSTIRLDTVAGSSYNTTAGKMDIVNYDVATTLNAQLIFDDMNVQDAFMLSNLNPNLGNAASFIRDGIGGNEANKAFNVQTPLDGMLSLLQRRETRWVMFIWAGIFFPGELTDVAIKYTMFNKKGNPIRGTADIRIRQPKGVVDKKQVLDYWDQAYQEFFEDASTASGGFSKVNNNILGINL